MLRTLQVRLLPRKPESGRPGTWGQVRQRGSARCNPSDTRDYAFGQSALHRRRHRAGERPAMCRNIKTLFNFEPPATEDEIRASALQFVRKLSGFNTPSQANAAAFGRAVD